MLLANEDHLLPLDKTKIQSIAVIGPFADYAQTGPNYTGEYSKFVKPLEGIQNEVGSGVKVVYARGSGIMETDNPEASLTEAVSAAKQADVAILFVGTNQLLEREGLDREFLNLPPVQIALVQRVMAANPKTVIVLLNGGPISLAPPYAGGGQRAMMLRYPTVLDMFWAGEEGGTAIADVLFGDYNPAGRMPYTVYAFRTLSASDDRVRHLEGIYIHVSQRQAGLCVWPRAQLYDFRLQQSEPFFWTVASDGTVKVSVDVQNSGNRAGEEVVQLYVHNNDASGTLPREQMQGFERINLTLGEKKTVTFTLPMEQLSWWDVSKHTYVIHPGAYDVLVGSASDDIRVKGSLTVTAPASGRQAN